MDLESNDTVPLLEPQPELQQPNNKRFGGRYGLLLASLFLYQNYRFVMAKYISQHNINLWDFVLVTSCYFEVMLLLCCVKRYENLMVDSPTEDRDWLKGVMWVLCSLLTCTFTWQISQDKMSWHMKIIIWGMAVSLLVVGFYFFVLFQTEEAQLANKYCKLDTDDDKEEKKFSELSAEDKV